MKQINERFIQFGEHDWGTIQQMHRCLDEGSGADYGVLCSDGHRGYAQPIGGVVAYRDRVSLSGVGYDIGCGTLACRTTANVEHTQQDIAQIMDEIERRISFGVGRVNEDPVEHKLFKNPIWAEQPWKDLKPLAESQLGTVGGGNHYVDIFYDEDNYVWVGVHFGSRGLGHKTATHFLSAAGGKDGMDTPPTTVLTSSAIGHDYLAGMHLAGEYAYAGREWVARTVAREILHAQILDEVHNHHNFAWLETHFGEPWWVVRKGATPAFPKQRGFVGGSMGDTAYIISGLESMDSRKALYSTVHGAGRVLGRREAKRQILREDMQAWLKRKGVYVVGGDVDEAPQAYRRLREVIRLQGETIEIKHTLQPIGVCMAGKLLRDPYKD